MGSGGGDRCGGGGAVKLVVSGTLTVNGTISANSSFTWAQSSGSGGSIWIDCGALAGTSTITANSYNTGSGYGSGGGRIAIYYHTPSTFSGLPAPGLYTNMESVSSHVTVKGGYNVGSDGPEDGSIYIVHVVPQGTLIRFL